MPKKKDIKIIAKLKKSWKKALIIFLIVFVFLTALYFLRSFFIVALVNGKPISRWTLNRELEKAAGQQILNTKIAETLVLQEAQKQKITVKDEEINQEIKKLEEQFQAQGQTLESVLALQGQSQKEFLKQLKIQLLVEKILGEDIEITEEEIVDYFEENKELLEEGSTLESERENINKTLFDNKLMGKIQPWLQDLQTKAKIHYFVEF